MKLSAVLAWAVILAQLALAMDAEAVQVGPYSVTVDLPGFDNIKLLGPIKNSGGIGFNAYEAKFRRSTCYTATNIEKTISTAT